jgi:hypothetical protein
MEPHEEGGNEMIKKRRAPFLHRISASMIKQHPALPILAFTCTLALSASLTSLNQGLAREQISHQSIFTSFFCIEAAVIYALYMIISRMLSFFLSYIESSSSSAAMMEQANKAGYLASYYYDHIDEENESLVVPPPPPPSLYRAGFNNGHREALISSMYLGGAGAFMALPALCFWDISVTASFLISLTLIALFSDHTKLKDFTPNQDKQHVLSTLKRFRWSLYGLIIALLLGVVFQDYNGATERPWAMMLLSFSSPLLMRMGTLNPRTIAHNIIMSPSQSLEVGLPISNLLAILVLCWYSPLDSVFRRHSPINVQLFVPMLVLCPSCLAAVLAFILRGFQNKQTLATVVPLVCTCIVVQQVMERRLENEGDWALVSGAFLALLISLLFVLYKRKVVEAPPPVVVEEEHMDEGDCHDLQTESV